MFRFYLFALDKKVSGSIPNETNLGMNRFLIGSTWVLKQCLRMNSVAFLLLAQGDP